MGCGCSNVRLAPVREQIIQPTACAVQQSVIVNRSCTVNRSSGLWTMPTRSNPAYVISNVFTAPFRMLPGRSLDQPDVVASYGYGDPLLEPVGEPLITEPGLKCGKCYHAVKKVTLNCDSTLMPVAERVTTVKVVRKTVMVPVSERITTIRQVQMQPVGERITTRTYSRPLNACDY